MQINKNKEKMKEKTKVIVTMPPYAPFIDEVLKHERVEGIRLNTVMPIKETEEELLKRLYGKAEKYNKDLWIDLKCRQLRVKTFGVPPFTEIELSHNIELKTPCKAYFGERKYASTILEVDKNRLIMQEGPRRVVGPGESVTIPDKSLKIEGYLTDSDKRYIEAANKADVKNFMLSFVEKEEDIEDFRKYNNKKNINILAKIESQKGLAFLAPNKDIKYGLMAARGDLYMELDWPHEIIDALELIISKDKNSVVASRIFDSLEDSLEPSSEDISDCDNLLRMGYRRLMFGDEVCLERRSIMSALNLLDAVAKKYDLGGKNGI